MTLINSKEYWDNRFQTDWIENCGAEQTRFFMEILVRNLSPEFLNFWNQEYYSIVDWGCAMGEGVDVLNKVLPSANIFGFDVSNVAVESCEKKFSAIATFTSAKPLRAFDICILSNVAEHFSDPWSFIAECLELVNEYCLVMVPFEEVNPIDEHEYVFTYRNIKKYVGDFFLNNYRVIDLEFDDSLWNGKQILLTYKKIGKPAYFSHEAYCASVSSFERKHLNTIKVDHR